MTQEKSLITFVGTGGVGKTSLSIAAAIRGGVQGRRVAAITVDPSRRLSSLLGIENDQVQSQQVSWPQLDLPIDIFYVDPNQVFQGFVEQNMRPEYYEKLKNNGIYQQISKNLRETHNFAALYKTVQVLSDDSYDLVILDTPPCHQVVDFFESPARLQRFFSASVVNQSSGWLRWMQEKGLQVAEGFLKTLVGEDFVKEMDHFFQFVGDIRSQIHEISEIFVGQLQHQDASLQLIFPPAADKIQDAHYLTQEIAKNDFTIDGYILNRAYPGELDFSEEVRFAGDDAEKRLYHYFEEQKALSEQVLNQFRALHSAKEATFVRIPEFSQTIHTLTDVFQFAERVNRYWEVMR